MRVAAMESIEQQQSDQQVSEQHPAAAPAEEQAVDQAPQSRAVFRQRTKHLKGELVYVTVKSATKSPEARGLRVQYGQYEGFVPACMFGPLVSLENIEELIGRDIPVRVMEISEKDQCFVFSNRFAATGVPGYEYGQVVTGIVQNIKAYGAYVDLGGVTGLLHVSQISHQYIPSIDTVLSKGDQIKVMVLKVGRGRDHGRLTLSTKKLEPTPGDMLRDPQLVFEKAEETAEVFRQRVAAFRR